MVVDVLAIQSMIFVISLIILYKAAEKVISAVIVLARFFGISEVAAGFLLLSVSTSLPELFVSIIAALEGQAPIVVGNVFGSNIANITLVLGFTIIVMGKIRYKPAIRSDMIGILIATSVIPVVMMTGMFSAFYGIALIAIFAIYTYYSAKKGRAETNEHGKGKPVEAREAVLNALAFGFAVCIVIVSAKFAIDSAVEVATLLGVSRAFVGATAIALGTSLPELAVNYVAATKRRTGIALGNILGSSMMNLTLVLGTAAVISPLTANIYAFFNIVAFAILVNAVLWFFLRKGTTLWRSQGIALMLLYALFLIMSIGVEIFT